LEVATLRVKERERGEKLKMGRKALRLRRLVVLGECG
jgi:hypothetical protein